MRGGGERVACIILFTFTFIKLQLGTKTINLNLKFCRHKNKNVAGGDVWHVCVCLNSRPPPSNFTRAGVIHSSLQYRFSGPQPPARQHSA